MKRTISMLLLVGCSVLQPAHAALSSVPRQTFEHIPVQHFTGRDVSRQELQQAVFVAATRLGWTATLKSEDRVALHLAVRAHTLDVEVVLQPKEYSIQYVSSTNLGAGEANGEQAALIHPKYHQWIKNLTQNIDSEIQRLK